MQYTTQNSNVLLYSTLVLPGYSKNCKLKVLSIFGCQARHSKYKEQRPQQRRLDEMIYEMEMKFWTGLGSQNEKQSCLNFEFHAGHSKYKEQRPQQRQLDKRIYKIEMKFPTGKTRGHVHTCRVWHYRLWSFKTRDT